MSEPCRLQQDSPRPRSRGLYLAILLAMIPWAILVWRFNWLCDDAFISFRFAKNLAAGHGLRFNLGAHPPVEGFSNFLWNVWIALFEFLRLDVTIWSRVTSILCSGTLLVVVTRFAQRTFDLGFRETLYTALFFATLPTIAIWSTGGLESMTACLLLFSVYERLLGNPERPHGFQAGALAILYALTREEAPGFIAVLLGLAVLTWLITRRKALLRAALTVLVLLAIAMTIHFAWRYAYYGDFISNTARLKAGFYWLRIERGVNYIVMVFITVPSCLAVLLLSFLPKAVPHKLLRMQVWLVIGANFVFVLQPGGDFMPMGRFLLVSMPFLTLLFAGMLRGLRGRNALIAPGFTAVMVILSLLPSFNIHPVPYSIREKFDYRWVKNPVSVTEYEHWVAIKKQTDSWTRLGKALKRRTKPGESLVIGTVGAIGYYSDLYIYDTCGLVNREVALRDTPPLRTQPGHDRAVPRTFFLKNNPTYLAVFVTVEGADQLTPEQEEKWYSQPISRNIKVERHSLAPEEGFGDIGILALLRYIPPK